MPRLINADPLHTAIAMYMAENAYLNDTALDVLKMIAKLVEEAPTVEAEPVRRHGSWVDGMDYTNSHWRVCSVCHKSAHHPAGGDAFCSNCGAKMDGESG